MNRPLCPHCYRDACPWLGAWRTFVADENRLKIFQPRPDREDCSLHDVKLAPNVRKRLLADLGRGT